MNAELTHYLIRFSLNTGILLLPRNRDLLRGNRTNANEKIDSA